MTDDKHIEQWLKLREKFRAAKKSKDYSKVITYSLNIIDLSQKAPFIGIFVPSFEYDIAELYNKLGDKENALKYYEASKQSFISYRATNPLHKPDDYLSDIARIDKRIQKLI